MSAARVPDDDLFDAAPTEGRARAAARLALVVGGPRRRTRPQFPSGEAWDRIVDVTTEMMETGTWDGATPKHHVALFEVCFKGTYEVDSGITKRDRQHACFLAAAMLKDKFSGDSAAFADYARWAWMREAEYEEFRREKGVHGKVLTWRRLFSGEMHAQWLIDAKRTASRPGR